MSRPSPSHRRHSRHRESWPARNFALIGLAIPGAVILVLFFLVAPGGIFVLCTAATLAALFTLGCLACVTGRVAASFYNFFRLCAGHSRLEQIMRADRSRPLPPRSPA